MKKIGLITLNGYFNYGNRLQNYALQEVLKTYGYKVDTIWLGTKAKETKNIKFKRKLINTLTQSPKTILLKIMKKAKYITNKIYINNLNKKRQEIFREFSKKYLHETSSKFKNDKLYIEKMNIYEYFVTGSDQVWNPHYNIDHAAYFLTFAPKEKRIAYAPSFGVDEIPADNRTSYSNWLNEMKSISVREDQGASIIKELTGKSAKVLVDPTLLLEKEDWLSIAKTPSNKPKSEYLLTYFLGDVSLKTKRRIKRIAKNNDLKLINLAKETEKTPFLTGPSEFIDYINSAKLFLTDSFHGGVFSILLETPFVIYDRKGKSPSMNSRINTLLNKFEFENRHINQIKTNADLFDIKFTHVESILSEERKKAFNYLNEALKINNNK